MATDTVSPASSAERLRGYAEIGGASLILGTSGALLQISTMPASLLLVTRMALAGLVLGPLFFLTGGVAEVRRSGHFWRLVLIGFTVACEMLFYFASIRLLQRAKEIDATIFTKSGIMVGLGEGRNEVLQVMDDLRAADVDFLTIGQYLQPSLKHHPVVRFLPPDEFKSLETIAYAKGFSMVAATPLTRSSHHAGEDFARLKALRSAR